MFLGRSGQTTMRGRSYTDETYHKSGDAIRPLICSPVILLILVSRSWKPVQVSGIPVTLIWSERKIPLIRNCIHSA